MTRGNLLLARIHANRDDDAPRLAYADWLSGQDDPRGEFIHRTRSRGRSFDRSTAPPRAGRTALWVTSTTSS